MATLYWIGQAEAVAQVESGSIDSVDGTPANNTFTVTIGGVAVSTVGDTDVATTAAALAVALNASTHPYFAAITWANPSAGTITGTADTAGCPFVAALTETGAGTGAVTDFSTSTACSGPNHWDTAANWSSGTVPVASDVVYVQDSAVDICWGLDQSAVDLNLLDIRQTFTGRIGLDALAFATTSNGRTTESKPEYRSHYLDVESDVVVIGDHVGPGEPAGSQRIKLDLGVHATTVDVHATARAPADSGMNTVRLLIDNSSSAVHVRSARGGVGVATDEGNETSTVGSVSVSGAGSSTRVTTGPGVTLTTWHQDGGTNHVGAAATVTTATAAGGVLRTEGSFAITTLNVEGGVAYSNTTGTVATCNLYGGLLDMRETTRARTITTLNWHKSDGAQFEIDPDVVTLTNKIALT